MMARVHSPARAISFGLRSLVLIGLVLIGLVSAGGLRADPAQAGGAIVDCCFFDGTCGLTSPDDCAMNGFDPGMGGCLGDGNGNGFDDACEQQNVGCCRENGTCVMLALDVCIQLVGSVGGLFCEGDTNMNNVDDACEAEAAAPALSPWALWVLAVLMVAAGGMLLVARPRRA
jgi:hypothetical protein